MRGRCKGDWEMGQEGRQVQSQSHIDTLWGESKPASQGPDGRLLTSLRAGYRPHSFFSPSPLLLSMCPSRGCALDFLSKWNITEALNKWLFSVWFSWKPLKVDTFVIWPFYRWGNWAMYALTGLLWWFFSNTCNIHTCACKFWHRLLSLWWDLTSALVFWRALEGLPTQSRRIKNGLSEERLNRRGLCEEGRVERAQLPGIIVHSLARLCIPDRGEWAVHILFPGVLTLRVIQSSRSQIWGITRFNSELSRLQIDSSPGYRCQAQGKGTFPLGGEGSDPRPCSRVFGFGLGSHLHFFRYLFLCTHITLLPIRSPWSWIPGPWYLDLEYSDPPISLMLGVASGVPTGMEE